MFKTIFHFLLISFSLLAFSSYSQDTLKDAPKNKLESKSIEIHSPYCGSSGINPYTYSSYEKDEVFIADRGGDLDQYLFKDSGTYQFDIDNDYSRTDYLPERDILYINTAYYWYL